MNVSMELLLTKEARSTLSETCHSATCSPQAPCVLPFNVHEQAPLPDIVFHTSLDTTRYNTYFYYSKVYCGFNSLLL